VARNHELEAAIEASPDDPAAYVVYADWLQLQGDPRGELIMLQRANRHEAAETWIDEHRGQFWGELWSIDQTGWRWRWGYFEAASVESARAAMLLEHPSARFLRELAICDYDPPGIVRVVRGRTVPTLRKLVLGDPFIHRRETRRGREVSLGDLDALRDSLPNLDSLAIIGDASFARLGLQLRELIVQCAFATGSTLATLFATAYPMLERLDLEIRGGVEARHLQPVFEADSFPKLKHLALAAGKLGDSLCEPLAASPLAAQLVSLDLSRGPLGDAGAAALAKGTFPKLSRLDVSQCFLTPAGIAQLQPLAAQLLADAQRDDGGDFNQRFAPTWKSPR
jgi:uncharacterized protein (TIGR02996 family)